MNKEWFENLVNIKAADLESMALELYRWQYRENRGYREFVDLLHPAGLEVQTMVDIPFLPVERFKMGEVKSGLFQPMKVFESSGTTGSTPSRHHVKDTGIYELSFREGFRKFYGDPSGWCILALLPSYLERGNSSLVYMAEKLIQDSGHSLSGFYLDEHDKLASVLKELESSGQQTLLLGVSFALLDFSESHPLPLRHTVIMETGGMKGRREELTRQELHSLLKARFGVNAIHSEYGMTELLSQAYASENGLFNCVPWMKMLIREEEDPLAVRQEGRGLFNIIDLANIYSCAFIATDDLGKLYHDGSFEVLGRRDRAEIRGCSLMLGGGS